MASSKSEQIALETERLRLRQWKLADYKPFAELNADPEVMRCFPATLSEGESNLLAKRIEAELDRNGWGCWAVELKKNARFIGFVGLSRPSPELPIPPAVEIAWRLARDSWGKGYATEAAQAVLRFAFEILGLEDVVAVTAVENRASKGLMEKLGMRDTGRKFQHPALPDGHPLREHALYHITRAQWKRTADSLRLAGSTAGVTGS